MIILHSFKSLGETFEVRASEWMLTGATLSLAFVFFVNDTMFLSQGFSGMREILNYRITWAWIFLFVGLLRLMVLTINGAYWRTPHLRALTAFLCSGVWFFLCVGFLRNGSVLAALVPWIFFLDVYNVKRASREAGKSEFLQRHVRNLQDQMHAGNSAEPQR
jgi:CHASE2 domain-containing sensor protein